MSWNRARWPKRRILPRLARFTECVITDEGGEYEIRDGPFAGGTLVSGPAYAWMRRSWWWALRHPRRAWHGRMP